ncbi:L-fucose/L-arabinose isomerase family protein [Phocaeicola plebeius]|uniref:L-fucose/L-arabinose isomerase family protein n=1 Tax=Phocaeicola plebeius TaxID=310297 RepID=UPI0026F125DB|nr:L-fucose/L-arabinose isomerase family protein [Phocaeicola plebeius]MDD6914416.1 L-fucose/L-arabinose isomerase family protein [Phocaeicola plebeius]MDY5978130.1 L-fucose/L-arabinose isomerase family protein [Phocaeicola plebeius]
MAKEKSVKVGLLGVGLNTYWNQFEGLRERLEEYQNEIGRRMSMFDVKVINVSIVDSQESAGMAVETLLKNRIDVLFVYVSTYALSSTILPVVQECRVPVLLLNIQPTAAIDFKFVNGLDDRGRMTGEWLAYCQACSIPEFASVFNRSGIKYDIIIGHLSDESMWKEIKDWLDAVRVVKGMRENRMGILGHYYTGMLDVYTDVTLQSAIFGTYIEQVEMCELAHYYESATEDELQAKLNEFHEKFDVSPQCEEYELQRAARTSIALDKLVEAHRLGSLAYYYEGFPGNSYENLVTSVIAGNTLLTGRGIPVAGECEVKNVQAMKIMSLLGAGGSFSEPYTIDFSQDVVLWGHDGPAHFTISEKKVQLVPLPVYHGKPGKGLSIQMNVKLGAVTLLSVCEGKDGVFLLVAEGESVPGDTLQIGNTNSRYRFSCGAKEFIEKWSKAGPSHHCAIGVGHVADKIEKVGRLLGIPTVRVC